MIKRINKKGQNYFAKMIVFFIVWFVSWIIWAIWLNGIEAAVAGCLTAIAVVTVSQIVNGTGRH